MALQVKSARINQICLMFILSLHCIKFRTPQVSSVKQKACVICVQRMDG
jgi:hypothetical protein